MNKYYNQPTVIDGIKFDSKKEAYHYMELKLLQSAGIISNLELQPKFILQESFKKNGKTYREISYKADFKYIEKGQVIVEDVKGKETEVFKIKHKLFEYRYPDLELRIVE